MHKRSAEDGQRNKFEIRISKSEISANKKGSKCQKASFVPDCRGLLVFVIEFVSGFDIRASDLRAWLLACLRHCSGCPAVRVNPVAKAWRVGLCLKIEQKCRSAVSSKVDKE
ncbi:MAG: hypothetical protein DME33_02165 [Verrucomicrobia bacterium]|nr:MAG: hypothetical protein DME33_02165 [Verrucomicrobiota bacterium]